MPFGAEPGGNLLLSGFNDGSLPPVSFEAEQAILPFDVGFNLQCLTIAVGFALAMPPIALGAIARLPAAKDKAAVRKNVAQFMAVLLRTPL